MEKSRLIFLVNDDIIGVLASYEPAAKEGDKPMSTLFKTFDKSIKKGDFVLVPTETRWKRTVVRVEEVAVVVDETASGVVQWLGPRVDMGYIENLQEKEQEMHDAIKAAEKRHEREELRKKMLLHSPNFAGNELVQIEATPAPPTDAAT